MKVILREDVSNLGQVGDVVEVRSGYGRNYLIPQDKAVLATAGNVRRIEHDKRVALAAQAKRKAGATEIAKRLGQVEITIRRRVGEQEKLFGSVTAIDIMEHLEPMELGIERRQIQLVDPIKDLGTYEVPVRIHSEVTQTVKVHVVAEE